MLRKGFSAFLIAFTFFAIFFIFSPRASQVCAYGNGDCDGLTPKNKGDICYTGSPGPDVAPGYQCGDKSDYVYDEDIGGSPQGDHTMPCSDGPGFANGSCCTKGTPLPKLPDHAGYTLGGQCSLSSICYTGSYSNPRPGQQCGGLAGWHYGTTGGNQPSVPSCAAIGIGNAVCCDVGEATSKAFNLNPCPSDSTNGDCKSIVTALGKIDVSSPTDFIAKAFGILLSFAGGIALIIIIFSGYRLLISQGDPEKVKNARETLTSAIVGLLFIIFSIVILQVIAIDIFHIPGFTK